MDRTNPSIRKFSTLRGRPLEATDGEIGTLHEIYFDDAEWTVRYFVVHTGGGLSGRHVLLTPGQVAGLDRAQSRLAARMTMEEIEGCPPMEAEPTVSRHYEELFHRYYEIAPYWDEGSIELPPQPEGPILVPPRGELEPKHPHLRSSDEVSGYRIHAVDCTLGHVLDFLLSDGDWRVRFLETETQARWPGRHVLISPAWIERVVWKEREVFVSVTRDAIRSAPSYDPVEGIGPDDEIRLFNHYGRFDVCQSRSTDSG